MINGGTARSQIATTHHMVSSMVLIVFEGVLIMKYVFFLLGMAAQASIAGVLAEIGLLTLSYKQQLLAAVAFLSMAFVLIVIDLLAKRRGGNSFRNN